MLRVFDKPPVRDREGLACATPSSLNLTAYSYGEGSCDKTSTPKAHMHACYSHVRGGWREGWRAERHAMTGARDKVATCRVCATSHSSCLSVREVGALVPEGSPAL